MNPLTMGLLMRFLKRLNWLQWILLGTMLLGIAGFAGLATGYASGLTAREKNLAKSVVVDLQTQFDLGLKDFEAGNYDLARQRFEYVLQQDPNFPGAIDMLAETLVWGSSAADLTIDIGSSPPTPSPTPDTRPADELFGLAEEQMRNQEWKNLVRTIVSLRDIDPLYRAVELDRMLFLGLRFSGIEKILNHGDLEGGVYDLALVERFAPLDSQAAIYQEWARLYQIGVSFWGVFPEKSVYYFSQLASAAPYLRDLSGMYAKDRYRLALLQYGEWLAQTGEWCLAFEQYELAQGLLDDQLVQPTLALVEEQCLFGGASPTPTLGTEILETPTVTQTLVLTVTPEVSVTTTVEVTLTPTPVEATPTPSPTEIELVVTPTPSPTMMITPTMGTTP